VERNFLNEPSDQTNRANQPGAHLRLVSDRAAGGTSGITLSGVSKTYRSRDGDVPSLRPLDFHINEGEFFVVVGPSGCGKSTLLKMISGCWRRRPAKSWSKASR
jgi:NitT/TauT family transport system ATP-binding protein